VQSSALIDDTNSLQQGSADAVAAHLSIGMTEPHHRQSGAIGRHPKMHRRRQDNVRSVVVVLHQSSSASGGAPCSGRGDHRVVARLKDHAPHA